MPRDSRPLMRALDDEIVALGLLVMASSSQATN
jgi:hypothetical protein